MHVNPALSAAMQRIDERARDVERAFTPGAQPAFDDAARRQTSYPTLAPLSVAAPHGAYFVTRDPNGELRYTRDGTFSLRNGTLCDVRGHAVLGYAAGRGFAAVRIDGVDRALDRATNPRIDAQGNLVYDRSVVDPRSGANESQRVVAGRVALARFPAGTRLGGDGEEVAPPSGVVPHYGAPADGNFPPLETMRRESSGVDIDRSLDRLRIAYRELDAMHAVYRAQYDAEKTAMDVVK